MAHRKLKFLSNCSPFVKCEGNGQEFECDIVRDGKHSSLKRLMIFVRGLFAYDAVILHQPGLEIIVLSLIKIFIPGTSAMVVGIDFQFARPQQGLKAKIKHLLWKLSWSRVDLTIGHMHYSRELGEFYGIKPEKYEFVPFKVNGYETLSEVQTRDEGYVFTGGYSWRDYETFCKAMASVGVPGKIITLNAQALRCHGTSTERLQVPDNVELVEHDKNPETWTRLLASARCVVLPISRDALCSNGVSVYLQAMSLAKCVIITRCPAVEGILIDRKHCIIVEQGDVEGMKKAIEEVWTNDEARQEIAERAREYAMSLGGVDSLMERLIKVVVQKCEVQIPVPKAL